MKIMMIPTCIINILISGIIDTSTITTLTTKTHYENSSNKYDEYSNKYDTINSGIAALLLGINSMRNEAGKSVSGNTLEIAIGTALQSDFFDWNKITSFNGIDNSNGMLDKAYEKINNNINKKNSIPIELKVMDATKLDFQSNHFDTVIDTFSMCVFPDPEKVLKEMVRVVKDDGKIILLENSISTNPIIRTIQDVSEPLVTPLSKGCKWNVDVPQLARDQGLRNIEYKDINSGTIMLGIYSKIDTIIDDR